MLTMPQKLIIHYYATADIALPTLDFLLNDERVHVTKVVTNPARPKGRGQELHDPEMAIFAKGKNVPTLQTGKIKDEKEYIEHYSKEENRPDIFIVFAFGQFLSQELLDIPKLGAFNIHASLLPSWRGAAPMQWSLLKGEKETGITIQRMVKKMDAGDIALQEIIPIDDHENLETLFEKVKQKSPQITSVFIDKILNKTISYQPQKEGETSFAPILKKEDGLIDFKKMNAVEVINKSKAFFPWPGIFCFLNQKRLKIFKVEIAPHEKLSPGKVSTKMGQLIVGCLDQAIRLLEIQLEGKKRTTDESLLNGLKDEITINN